MFTYLEVMADNVSLSSCSESSLTPTNSDIRSSPSLSSIYSVHNNHMCLNPSPPVASKPTQPILYGRQRSKEAPPPPVRRTSQLSNPFAITMRTLKEAGVSTYAEIQTLRRASMVSRHNSVTNDHINCKRDDSDIYCNINYNTNITAMSPTSNINNFHQSIIGRSAANTTTNPITTSTSQSPNNYRVRHDKTHSEYAAAKSVFEKQMNRITTQTTAAVTCLTAPQTSPQSTHSFEDETDLSSLPLPPPPPEAFSDTEASHSGSHHYNKITNVHRQFLESLNTKLAQYFPQSSTPQSHRVSPRLPKRRSMSLSRNDEHNWTAHTDSFVPNRPTITSNTNTAMAAQSQPQSFQKTLRMLIPANRSNSSSSSSLFYSSSHRHQSSADTSMKKCSSHTMTSYDRESLMASLNEKLAQRQRYEAAKFARKSNYK